MPDGLDFGSIGDQIGSLLAAAICFILDFLLFVLCFLIQAIFFLYDLIVFVGSLLLTALKKIGGLFSTLWHGGIRGFFSSLWTEYQKLTGWLRRVFGPLINAIKQIHQALDLAYRLYVKPILDVLQRVRKVLFLLHLLHLNFADALDKRLAFIEGKISGIFVALVKQVNEMATAINSLVDPLGLIHGDILLRSIAGSVQDVFGQLHQLQDAGVGASAKTSQSHDSARLKFASVASVAEKTKTGTPDADTVSAIMEIASSMSDLGYNPGLES